MTSCVLLLLLLPCLADMLQPVRTFTTRGFCFVHVGNVFESEGGTTLDVDLGVFDSANILNDLKMSVLRQGAHEGHDLTGCQYMRLSLPLSDTDPDAADSSSNLPVSALSSVLLHTSALTVLEGLLLEPQAVGSAGLRS